MNDRHHIKQRYMQDNLSIRLGGLAANLARIHSFSDHTDHRDIVLNLVDESKFFIEWNAPEAEIQVAAELVTLQLRLAQWQYGWESIWKDSEKRASVAREAEEWSKRVLTMAGLL